MAYTHTSTVSLRPGHTCPWVCRPLLKRLKSSMVASPFCCLIQPHVCWGAGVTQHQIWTLRLPVVPVVC